MKAKDEKKLQLKYSGMLMRHWYWCVLATLLLLLLTAAVLYVDTIAGCIVGGFTVVMLCIVFLLDLFYRPKVLSELMDYAHRFGTVENELLKKFDIPYILVQSDGKILWMNDLFQELVGKKSGYHKSITTLFGEIRVGHLPTDEEDKTLEITHDDKKYRVTMKKLSLNEMLNDLDGVEVISGECAAISMHFFDITELSAYKKENFEQKAVVGLLYMDNYDEVMESVEDVRRSMLEALVDRKITKYISSLGGVIKKLEKDKYLLVVNRKELTVREEDRFSILEDVKTVNIGNSMNMTISIGIGTDQGDYARNFEAARVAIEMALARGGDQAVLKEGDKMTFYGGKTQRAERNTRVRARVKAQALREMISTRDKVIVMGHRMTDIDSLGACIGVCIAAQQVGKQGHIVLGDISSGIRPWVEMFRSKEESEEKLFVTHEQAIEMTDSNTVVVVVDTNKPKMVECEELLYLTKTIVVLDHHRQSTEKIENAALSYVEPSASSACEMVSEILQYYDDNIKLKPTEADCIYAGIIVDTDNFMAKTSTRTFEAAAFLRQNGADMSRVRKAFRNDMNTYKAKAEAVRHAETFMDSYAISICPSAGLESPTVVGAQAANELLNIIGVKASFVLTEFHNKIFISARAIDEVNVQIIMERMGGGGHMNIAGAQLANVDIDEARVKLKEILTQMTKEGAI